MWKSVEVEIFRKVDLNMIGNFDNADAEDGILLNHDYVDMRGCLIDDALAVVQEEADLLKEIEAAVDDDEVEALMDELVNDFSELSTFDVGTAGAIYALSAAGAAPISSCNGGLFGGSSHSSDVPHVLFSIKPSRFQPILKAAETADIGLLNHEGHVEVFATTIPHLHLFADRLVQLLATESDDPS